MAKPKRYQRPPEVCPVCGEDVPPTARACRHCGADHESGWKDEVSYGGADLPEENFDYDDFIKREFQPEIRPRHLKPIWWVTGIVVLVVLVWMTVRR